MQRVKPADFDLARNLRMSFAGGLIELNTENVADRVALKCAADASRKPMHVLQAAITIVWRHKAERCRHLSTPGLGKIFHAQAAIKQLQLQVEAQHNMKIVGDLVGIASDQGPVDFVDGAIEGFKPNVPEMVRKCALQSGIKMLPETPAAADYVFPKAGLAFVHPR